MTSTAWNSEDHDLLTRIDERTEKMCETLEALITRLESDYVTKAEFWPVKTIVYAGAGMILVAVVGAVIALVVRGHVP